jgi:GMP synthase (glutamine-hydrolysing)
LAKDPEPLPLDKPLPADADLQGGKEMARLCAAVRHVHFEDLGTFAGPIEMAGYSIRYIEAGIDDLDAAKSADLAVFLGGPIGVYETLEYPFLEDELHIAADRLDRGLPMLGICLGAQLIAGAAGAEVFPGNNGKELGWKPLKPTADGLADPIAPLATGGAQILHWHGDTFDLPPQATLLASTDLYENQIYEIGAGVLAFQCHPEIDASSIERWLIGHALEIAKTDGVSPITLREETRRYGSDLALRSRKVITNWLARISPA